MPGTIMPGQHSVAPCLELYVWGAVAGLWWADISVEAWLQGWLPS